MEIRQPDALSVQPIEVWSFQPGVPVTAKIAITLIVCQYDYNVRAF
jgi:hypothetical protein